MRTLQGPRDPGTHPGRLPVAPSLPTSAQRELSTVQRLNSRARGVFSPLRGGSAAKLANWVVEGPDPVCPFRLPPQF